MTIASVRYVLPVALLLASATPLAAARPATLTVDCASRSLPSQRAVGEFLGLHNQGQVYAARSRLMAQAARACQADGAQRIDLVLESARPSSAAPATGLATLQDDAR